MSPERTLDELIDDGASLADLLAAARRTPHPELQARLRLARTFDADVYAILTRDLDGAPSFEEAVALDFVESLPRQPSLYRLTDAALEGLAPGDPKQQQRISRELAGHYRERGDAAEALFHTAAFAPDKALRELEKAFAAADGALVLNVCRDLVRAVRQGMAQPEEHHEAALVEYERYLEARGRWIDDWYRTTRFVESRQVVEAFERLLDDSDSRVLSLWARGGMGKTMYLRWLAARRCVQREQLIPYARIDFDVDEARSVSREPWLLALELAAQLQPQLKKPLFADLLDQYGHHRRRLAMRDGERDEDDPLPDILAEEAVADLRERFVTALAQLGDERVVLVVDTLEDALLPGRGSTGQTNLTPLIEELARACTAADGVRLALAGRYQLTQRIEDLGRLLAGVEELELLEFESDDVKRLFALRGIDRRDLIEPVLTASKGVPLKIAMLADVIETAPQIESKTIAANTDVELFYLTNRVFERVHPALREVVRLGVVVRRLDERTLANVVYPNLPDSAKLPPVELWAILTQYAGTASWVDFTRSPTEAVRFHPEVVGPMRRLLHDDPLATAIHRDAVRYFEHRAQEDPRHVDVWGAEAAYHRFQLEGPAAGGYWRLIMARLDEQPDARHNLAADLLGRDYLDDDELVERADGGPLLSRALELEARLALGMAAVHRARAYNARQPDAAWHEARDALEDIRHLRSKHRDARVASSRLALLEAHVRLQDRQLEAAEPLVTAALRSRLTPRERFSLRLAYAEAIAATGGDATAAFETARRAARGELAPMRREIAAERLAAHLTDRGRLNSASRLLRGLQRSPNAERAARATIERGWLALKVGLPLRALTLVRPIVELDDPMLSARARLVAARANMALGRNDAALWLVRHEIPPKPRLHAAQLELEGEILGQKLKVVEATERLDEAAAMWTKVEDPAGVCRAHVKSAELALRLAGDHRGAWRALRHARRVSATAAGPEHVRRLLLESELAAAEDEEERAREHLRAARAVAAKMSPRVQARIAMAGLAFDAPEQSELHVRALTAALSAVQPPNARVAMLEPLQRCRPLTGVSEEARAALRAAVPSALREPKRFTLARKPEIARLRVLDAELDRVLGSPTAAELAPRDFVPAEPVLTPAGGEPVSLLGLAVRVGADAIMQWLAEWARKRLHERPSVEDVPDAATLVDSVTGSSPGRQLPNDAREALNEAIERFAGIDDARLWIARGSEALAADARERGERADELAGRAARIYATLGDESSKVRALQLAGELAPPARERDPVLRLRLDADGVVVSDNEGRHNLAADARVAEAVYRIAAGETAEGAGWRALARLLLESPRPLAAPQPWMTPTHRAVLSAEPRLLHALPWERTVAPGVEFYRAGQAAPLGGQAPEPSLRSVLLILPHALKEARRGAALAGAQPEDAYRARGYVTRVLADGDPNTLAAVLRHEEFSVIHLCCGLIDAHGTPALVLRPDVHDSRSGVFFSSTFGLLTGTQRMQPTIVLDVPPALTPHEAMLQLLLRNAFATDVAGNGSGGPVLATGLIAARERAKLLKTLTELLWTGADAGRIAAQLRAATTSVNASAAFVREPA